MERARPGRLAALLEIAATTPPADGDREALRILLSARSELTTVTTVQPNRLRALLLGGDVDRRLARGRLTDAALTAVAPVASPAMPIASTTCGTPRSAALALCDGARADLAPGLTDRRGTDPVTAIQAFVSFSHAGRCRDEAVFAALVGTSPVQARSGRTVRYRLNRGADRLSTGPSTLSPLPGCAAAPPPRPNPGLRRPPQN